MPKRTMQTHSRPTLQAVALLGRMIKARRLEAKLSAAELAERAGISRALVYRIERGDPSCSIGAAFEAAVIVRAPLFGGEDVDTGRLLARTERELALLPRTAHGPRKAVRDEF